MNEQEKKLDKETIDSAFSQIHYYINLPKHIKGTASNLELLKLANPLFSAHVVDGATTVVKGKLNIPLLNKKQSFNQHNNYFFS